MDGGQIRGVVEDSAKHNVICKRVDGSSRALAYEILDNGGARETNGAQRSRTLNAMKTSRSCLCLTETSRIAKPATNSNPPHGRARVIFQDLYLLQEISVSVIADKVRASTAHKFSYICQTVDMPKRTQNTMGAAVLGSKPYTGRRINLRFGALSR